MLYLALFGAFVLLAIIALLGLGLMNWITDKVEDRRRDKRAQKDFLYEMGWKLDNHSLQIELLIKRLETLEQKGTQDESPSCGNTSTSL